MKNIVWKVNNFQQYSILNVKCDKLAKKYVQESATISTTIDNPEIEEAQPHLQISGKTIC